MIMFDSINVDAIPPGATDLLGYTDGRYANIAALRARFPHATIHTISCTGQVVAEWIDVEPGCLWPNSNAADLFRVWRHEGCRGYYSFLNNMQALKEAHNAANPGVTAEYFDADGDNIQRVDPGYVATQFEQTAGYDVSDTSPTFEDTPVPAPIPPVVLPPLEEDVTPYPLTVTISNGEGWSPLPAGVSGSRVVSVVIVDSDPVATDNFVRVPAFTGVTNDGTNRLVFGPGNNGPAPNGDYACIAWVAT